MDAPDFMIIGESLLNKVVCTSLSDERASDLIGPSGTTYGWQISETGFSDTGINGVPCADNPETHRHILFNC